MTPDDEATMRLLDAIEGAPPPLNEDPVAMMLGIVKPYCNLGHGDPTWRGYTRKVGLRKPEWDDDEPEMPFFEWLEGARAAFATIGEGIQAWQLSVGRGLMQVIEPTYRAYTTPEPVDPATCPHCCCTYTTECCYCDGSRTPLEDS